MRKNEYYPYLILLASCGLVAVTFGIINTQGLFFESMCADLGVGKGTLSLYITINFLVAAPLSSSICPKIRAKYPIKLVLTISSVVMLIFLLLLPTFKSVYLFYLFGVVLGAGTGFYGHTLAVELINNWIEKSGTATGIALSASGVFGTLFSPLAVSLINQYGWRKAYYVYALIYAIVMIYAIVVIKKSPDDKQVVVKQKVKEKSALNKDVLMLGVFYLAGGAITAMGTYMLPYCLSLGLSSSQGAMMSSSLNAGNLILKLILGFLSDKIGGFKTAVVNFIFITIGVIALLFCNSNMYIILLIGAFFLGSCYGSSNVTMQGICKDLFGRENVAKYYSALNIFSLISAFSTTLVGYSYDLFNTYKYAIIFLEISLAIGLLLILLEAKLLKNKKN